VGAGNRIAFGHEAMEFGSFQADGFANEMRRDAAQIFDHLAASLVVAERDFNGNFTNVQDVLGVMNSSGESLHCASASKSSFEPMHSSHHPYKS
jgi:hypothetical protein